MNLDLTSQGKVGFNARQRVSEPRVENRELDGELCGRLSVFLSYRGVGSTSALNQ